MSDKSPRSHMSKKASKSIKEKRADKQARTEGKAAHHLDIHDIGKKG